VIFFLASLLHVPLVLQDMAIHLLSNSGLGYLSLLMLRLSRLSPLLPLAPLFALLVIVHFWIRSASNGRVLELQETEGQKIHPLTDHEGQDGAEVSGKGDPPVVVDTERGLGASESGGKGESGLDSQGGTGGGAAVGGELRGHLEASGSPAVGQAGSVGEEKGAETERPMIVIGKEKQSEEEESGEDSGFWLEDSDDESSWSPSLVSDSGRSAISDLEANLVGFWGGSSGSSSSGNSMRSESREEERRHAVATVEEP
jgi:hypothetical protein